MKIIDFGKYGKIDVHKQSFNFDFYKIIVPDATIEMFNELKSDVYIDENLNSDIEKLENSLSENIKKTVKKHKK